MERKVFTYKDVEEAKKYLGKRGVASDSLFDVTSGNGHRGELEEVYTKSKDRIFKVDSYFQFFSPDPEPVEKWVPFTAEDWQMFMGKPIRTKRDFPGRTTMLIVGCNPVQVYAPRGEIDYALLMESYEFMDGTPCGKRVKE